MKRRSWGWTWPLASTSQSEAYTPMCAGGISKGFLMDKMVKSKFLTNWIRVILGNTSHYTNTIGCKCCLDCNSASGKE